MTNLNSSATNPNGQPASLLPCPFCGGEAELCVHEPTGVSWVRCIECETSGGASNAFCTVKAWNRRAERTCRNVSECGEFQCSECDQRIFGSKGQTHNAEFEYIDINYCPNCGARVVE